MSQYNSCRKARVFVGSWRTTGNFYRMGNLCSVFREVFEYALRCVLPRYTAYFPGGYNAMIGEDLGTQEAVNITLESEKLSIKYHDSSVSIGDPSWDYSDQESAGNTNFLLGVVNDFFENYNSQTHVLSGRSPEKNLSSKRKYDEQTSWNWQHLNRDEAIEESLSGQPNWNIRQEDFIPGFNDIIIDTGKSDSESESIEGSLCTDISIQNGSSSKKERSCGTEIPEENPEIDTKSKADLSSNRRRKYGRALTDETLRRKEQFSRNFSRSFSLVDRRNSTDQNSDDSHNTDRQISKEKRTYVRKLSLQRLHSGCHYSENEEDHSFKFTYYTQESTPLIVPVESYWNISSQNLCSGGLVAFKELSRHLSIPDYYAQRPIVYDELPPGVEFPKTSPLELPSQEPQVRPTSCSGGGLVPVSSRKASLPDIFPERNPVLNAFSSGSSTQSSTSSGELATDENTIFSDLISESLRYDGLLEWQAAVEKLNQPWISRYTSEAEVPEDASQVS